MRQLWTQAAVIALTAGTLSACATDAPQYPAREGQAPAPARTMPTPNFPITQAPVQPQAAAPSAANETDAAETLPPPQAITTQPIPTQAQPAVTRSDLPPPPAPTPAPQPVLRPVPSKTVVTTTVTGPVVNVPGKPQVHVVKSGDTLTSIAKRFDVNVNDLAKDNDFKKGQTLRLGQKITGPASEQKAYVVQTGDTIFAIAKRFNVTAAALADENDLKTGSAIKKGQKLVLPDGYKDKGPIKTTTVVPGTPGSLAGAETTPAPTAAASRPTTTAGATPSRPTRPPADEAPEPTTVSTTSLSVTGAVVSVAGPRQVHTVKSGDTLTAIARKFDMSVSDLADDNKLDTDKPLKLGAKIKGPATTSKAYVAQSGDTLGAVAKRFNVSVKELAAENNLRSTASVKKGQKLVLPDGYKDKGPIKTTTTVTRPSPAEPSNTYAKVETPARTPSSPVPYTPSGNTYPRPSAPVAAQPVTPPPSTARPIIESSAAPTEAEIVASGRGKFAWPVRGEIALGFGANGPGQRNDGLDIRAPQGTPVVSAADGKVAYAGNQVLGFGNLVLVRHADGWVTAYARLSSINVKMQQDVKQGEQLGAVGTTGGATEPALHFEMRYAPTVKDKAKPVNPSLVLPPR
jgi:murein DD-endopeptidase MepM/ murein hydrolase activator NlpD